MILLCVKDGKLWPRHENGEWFTATEREAWHQANIDTRERLAADIFNKAFIDLEAYREQERADLSGITDIMRGKPTEG